MQINIVGNSDITTAPKLLGSSDISKDNWDEKAQGIAVHGRKDDLEFGLSLNVVNATKSINHYLKKNPVYIKGGEDTEHGTFDLDLLISKMDLSIPKAGQVRFEVTFTGVIYVGKKKFKPSLSIALTAETSALSIEDNDGVQDKTYSIYLNAEKLKWLEVNGWKVFNVGLAAKIVDYISNARLNHIFLYSFELNGALEYELEDKIIKIDLPAPEAHKFKLMTMEKEMTTYGRMEKEKILAFGYAENSGLTVAGLTNLGGYTSGNRLISAAVSSYFLYEQAVKIARSAISQYTDSTVDLSLSTLDGSSISTGMLQQYKIKLNSPFTLTNPEDKVQLSVTDFGLLFGRDSSGRLTAMLRIGGKAPGVEVFAGVSAFAEPRKPKGGNQDIHIEIREDYLTVQTKWWVKLLGFLAFGILGAIVKALVKHYAPKVIDKQLEKHGTFDIPVSFADYAYVDQLTFNIKDLPWMGPTLVNSEI